MDCTFEQYVPRLESSQGRQSGEESRQNTPAEGVGGGSGVCEGRVRRHRLTTALTFPGSHEHRVEKGKPPLVF